jgi:hypothetical protein
VTDACETGVNKLTSVGANESEDVVAQRRKVRPSKLVLTGLHWVNDSQLASIGRHHGYGTRFKSVPSPFPPLALSLLF